MLIKPQLFIIILSLRQNDFKRSIEKKGIWAYSRYWNGVIRIFSYWSLKNFKIWPTLFVPVGYAYSLEELFYSTQIIFEISRVMLIQKNPLNVITFGQAKRGNINWMITLTVYSYLVVINKWDAWNVIVITLSGW